MRRLWMRIRMPLAVITVLLITLAMARLFSGPEDTWTKNERGEWIKHGYPAGPAPTQEYQEPISRLIVPLGFLVSFAVPLFLLGLHKPHNRLTFDAATRDLKFFGYLSTALVLFGILVGAGVMFEIALAFTGSEAAALHGRELLFLFSLMGFAGLCILVGIQFFALKRSCNDHYQLEKSYRELREVLESRLHG